MDFVTTDMALFKMHIVIPLLCAFLGVWQCIAAQEWCYQSQVTCDGNCIAPAKWVDVNVQCGGTAQSPINIVTRNTPVDIRLTPFKFTRYQETFQSSIINNGHTVELDLDPANTLVSGGNLVGVYKAVQLHWHWGNNGVPGSEHTIDGERAAMELHIVNIKEAYGSLSEAAQDPTGIAVLAFFYQEADSSNRKYDPIINALSNLTMPDNSTALTGLSLDALIPSEFNRTSYFRYNGSLTTPNCSESVVWTVFQNTIPLSKTQLAAFFQLQFADGKPLVEIFRPAQRLNGRQVYRSSGHVVFVSTMLLITSGIISIGLSLPS